MAKHVRSSRIARTLGPRPEQVCTICRLNPEAKIDTTRIRSLKLRILLEVGAAPESVLDLIASIRHNYAEYRFIPVRYYFEAIAELAQDGLVRLGE